ncbi:MAG: Dyp-type peroxidase [Frankiaceae bacterium]|nr:Dyp-type peroxidase [Frankiaceae bacterium]MBV9869181.1 Dyp-type peroxidase [Frankiaceae bacterium]
MASTAGSPNAETLRDVQGGLIGFNKDFQRLVFVNFADKASGEYFVRLLRPFVVNGERVLEFNRLYKGITSDGLPGHDIQSIWINLWLSFPGLQMLDAPSLDAFPEDFKQGMAARASLIGDQGRSAPDRWQSPFENGALPHAIVVIAADTNAGIGQGYADVAGILSASGASELLPPQDGHTRPLGFRGREQFGFKDGISQPGIKGLTVSSKSKTDVVAAGEFLIGYPNEDGDVSGQPSPTPPPQPTPYNPTPPPPLQAQLPGWATNGTFVVYRRLQQDVGAFIKFKQERAGALNLTPDTLGAKLLGRWPSGAPMEHVPGEGKDIDPAQSDPSEHDQAVLNDDHINNFNYDEDHDGTNVPRAAHVRKSNPRSIQLPDGDRSNRHRILRRGIPYGDDFVEGEPPYGEQPQPAQDRGLLFVCFQASIARGFEFVQGRWANAPGFQEPGDGEDPIISQDNDPRVFRLPRAGATATELSIAQWVFTMGGGYFFAPSLTGLRVLSVAAAG